MKQNFLKKALLTILSAGMISFAVQAGEVEVLHYWTSGGEAKSVVVLKQLLEKKGHTWKDFSVAGGGGENAMTVLKSRVFSGNAPAAAQIKGPSIQEWGEEGVLGNLNSVARAGNWDKLLPKVVSDVMKYEGNYVAAPVNVHRVNWMWINPSVFLKSGAKIPTNWDEFEAAAKKIKKAGFIPVAHGGQAWQDATTFESVVLGVGGADFYRKAFVDMDLRTLGSPTMVKSFKVLKTIKKYTDKNAPGRDWNIATSMVIKGEAAMQFMGDWAKGEFTAAGKTPGLDYLCLPAPGTSGTFTFNIDSMAMFKLDNSSEREAQKALAKTIMSPQFQEVFNLNKGSIPARQGVTRENFDSCAQSSMDAFAASSASKGLVPSFAHGMSLRSGVQGAVYDVVTNFYNSSMSPEQATKRLVSAVKANM